MLPENKKSPFQVFPREHKFCIRPSVVFFSHENPLVLSSYVFQKRKPSNKIYALNRPELNRSRHRKTFVSATNSPWLYWMAGEIRRTWKLGRAGGVPNALHRRSLWGAPASKAVQFYGCNHYQHSPSTLRGPSACRDSKRKTKRTSWFSTDLVFSLLSEVSYPHFLSSIYLLSQSCWLSMPREWSFKPQGREPTINQDALFFAEPATKEK